MTSTMKDWITPAAVDGLSGALETLTSDYAAGETLHKHPYDCGPEAVTVHLQKGHHVQLIEFNGRSHDPSNATLSDGTTRIRATFTVAGANGFGTGHDAVENALGAVLAIQEYSLTFKPSSPPSERLTLRVSKFKVQGCHGERAFGQPRDIEKQERLWNVLMELENVLASSESKNSDGVDEDIDIRSQAGDTPDRQNSPVASVATQPTFATQVPSNIRESKFQSAVSVPTNHSVSKGADILALLKVPKEKAAEAEAITSATTSRKTVNVRPASVLQPVSESRKAEISSKLESKANSQSSMPSSDPKEYARPPKESNLPLPSNSIPDDSEKENSQESSDVLISRPIPIQREAEPVPEAKQRNMSDIFISNAAEDNPFEGMKRVPRSYVRIPANQQALLDSKDSWWQPECHSRATYANLPAVVTDDLNALIHRKEHGRKIQAIDNANSSAYEESGDDEDEDDELSEDDVIVQDGANQIVPQVDQSRKSTENDSISDAESIQTWEESQYGDPDPDDFEAAPGLTFEDAHVNETSITMDIPSARKVNPRSPRAPNISVPPKPRQTAKYMFPSSSPGDEEELEIVVPYGIDDQVNEDVAETGEEPETSQELPSTAVANQPVIQVDHTPDQYVIHGIRCFNSGQQSNSKHQKQFSTDARMIDGHVSSDPVIPATFHDSSQAKLPSSQREHTESGDNQSPADTSSGEEEPLARNEDCLLGKVDGEAQDQDEITEEEVFAELVSSQQGRGQTIDSSSHFPFGNKPPKKSMQATPSKNKKPRSVSPSLRSSQLAKEIPSNTALPEMRSELARPSSSPVSGSFLKPSNSLQRKGQSIKNSLIIKSPGVNHSQTNDETDANDLYTMLRTARRSFKESPSEQSAHSHSEPETTKDPNFRDTADLCKDQGGSCFGKESSPMEDSPVVQIAQTQSDFATTKEPSSNLTPASAAFPSNDFVRSTIPERTGDVALKDNVSEDLPTSPSKEPSPTMIPDQPQLSPNSKVPKPHSFAPLQSVPRADDHKTAAFMQSTQNSEQHSGEYMSNRNADVVSISSNSDEEEIAHEDEASVGSVVIEEDKIADHGEIIVAANQAAAANIPQDAATQHGHNSSPESTAFHKFKLSYPSYSGKEKNFVWALVYIEWLVETKGEHFLRASLWDDLIRTLATEYMGYIKEVRDSEVKIQTGFEFFNKLDKTPIFQQRIITPENLHESLLTLDPAQVGKVRLLFNRPTPPLADHWRSSEGSPSDASKTLQNNETQEKTMTDVVGSFAELSRAGIISQSRILEAFERTSTKRPFFETASQLEVTKKPRTHASAEGQRPTDTPNFSKTHRSLPWSQITAPPPPSPKSIERPVKSATAASPRVDTTATIPKAKQRSTTSISPSAGSPILGDPRPRPYSSDIREIRPKSNQRSTSSTSFNRDSPASPILGDARFKSRSFNANVRQSGSAGQSPLFRKPSAPVTKAALMQQSRSPSSKEGKVEGWLDDAEGDESRKLATPTPVPKLVPRKDSLKRKRESVLELLDVPTPSSGAASKSAASTPAASKPAASKPAASKPAEVRRKPSFREFLQKKRRESGQASKPSTPDSKAASASGKSLERTPLTHTEPETQAWGV